MKKLLLFSLTILSLFANGQTSVYHPFPDSNAVWNIDSYQPCGLGFDTWEHLYSIIISGDTIINTINYHKLEVPIEVIVSNGHCYETGTWTSRGYYVGSIRQDTLNRKVFYIPAKKTAEELLYDFTMQVGDTVQGYIESLPFPVTLTPDVVQSIDSVLVGSTYRKRWNINPYYNINFIEGIGSTYGLIEQSPHDAMDFPDYTITCFHQNGETLYPDVAMDCDVITSVPTLEKNVGQIQIFPNPSNGKFIIETKIMRNVEIEIYNMLAEKIFTITHFKQQISNEIDLSVSPKGIYFVKINDGGKVYTEKIVIE